jgi:hypothetical protein
MATVTLVKNLKNGNRTLLEILNSFIFGNSKIELFNSKKTYKKGDLILVETDDGLEIRQAKVNVKSKEYKEHEWTTTIVKDWFINLSTNIAMISDNTPTELDNVVIWYKPIRYYSDVVPSPDTDIEYPTEMTTLFNSEAFLTDEYENDEVPEEIDIGVFFDIESSEEVENYSSDDKFEDDPKLELDENEDMLVNDNPPTDSDTVIWGDTDLTDNI